jgi:lycopene epsilon-cyclase
VRAGGCDVTARIVTLAGGAVSAKFLKFEDDAPPVAAQTAYGITAVVEGYSDAFDPETMLFMDYRRMHSGLWNGTGPVLSSNVEARRREVWHPNWDANHGSCKEAPSFLYAMPLGGGEVFLEETCLVARPTLPFAVLKRRLLRRCAAMGIVIKEVCAFVLRPLSLKFAPLMDTMQAGVKLECHSRIVASSHGTTNLVVVLLIRPISTTSIQVFF